MNKADFENRIIAMEGTLYRVSATLLHQQCDREDAIQECILKALQKREKLRDDRAMQAWVIRILINECYAILRQKKRICPVERVPEMEAPPKQEGETLKLLFSLREKLRLPMMLYYAENYSTEEIARMLRIPVGTVRSRLARGRDKIRQLMEKEAMEE